MELLKKYPSLIKDVIDHKCVFFIGAGVSESAGMPNANALSNEIGKDLIDHFLKTGEQDKLDKVKNNLHNLEETARFYQNIYGERRLRKKVSEIIEVEQKKANRTIFEKIIHIPRNDFITTNYDTLLESAYPSSKDVSVIWEDKHLVNYYPLQSNIFKIHGTFQDPSSIKILKEDFTNFQKTAIYKNIISQFTTKTIVIIGYSCNDIDFYDFFNEAYAVWPDVDVYIVTLHIDPLIHNAWQQKGAKILEGGADNFFSDLIDSVHIYNKQKPPEEIKEVPKGEIKKEDQNPFKFYTTDGLKPDQFIELYRTFVPPEYSDFMKMYSIDKHHILQGGRGTGKTVILRGISIENLLISHKKTDFIGFWVPLSTPFLGCVKREKEETEIDYFKFFASYLTILIIEKIFHILLECKDNNYLVIDKEREEKFVSAVFHDLQIKKSTYDLTSLYDEIIIIRGNYHKAYNRNLNRQSSQIIDPVYLRSFLKRLSILDDYFNNKYFFVMLDDAQFMDIDQRKVLVSFLSHREYPLSFKIGTSQDYAIYTDFFNATIQDGKDFETLYLDRVAGQKGLENYKKFLENLANMRLNAFNQSHISIKELLPEGERKKGEYYNGFDVYAILSSQIIRDFITLIKDTIYYAYPQIAFEYVQLKPIPPNVQNEVIYIKSTIHLKEVDAAGDLRDDVLLLIETLGRLFKNILEKSKQVSPGKELRTATGIEIKNFHNLNDRTKIALKKAVELQLLQIPLLFRIRQKTETPNFGVKFHKLLIPYYRLRLGYRYPRQVDAALLNQIFDSPDKFVNSLTKSLDVCETESESEKMEIEYWLS